jgi:hypothetical protein
MATTRDGVTTAERELPPHVEAHEAVHRAQWAARGVAPIGSRADLEHDAERGARAMTAGSSYRPAVAAPPGMTLHYDPDPFDWMPDPQAVTERELRTDDELMLEPDESANVRIEQRRGTDMAGVSTVSYTNITSGRGRKGVITSTTEITVIHDPGAPTTTVMVPSLNPMDELAPKEVPAYPVSILYARTIEYSDADGRACLVEIAGGVHFTHEQWLEQLEGRDPSFENLQQLVGDNGSLGIDLDGTGPIANFPYHRNLVVGGSSIAHQLQNAVPWLGFDSDPLLGVATLAPADFIRPELAAGEQFDSLNKFLFAMDQREIARRAAEDAERARAAAEAEEDESWLDAVGDWLDDNILGPLGGLWNAIPAPVRGVIKAVGKAALAIGVVIGAAAVIVALSPVELTVAGVALAIGGALLLGSFINSLFTRSEEAEATGEGGASDIALVSLADAVGVSGVYEAVTNESMLSGVDLGLSEEERWERGTLGGIQVVGTALGARAVIKRTPFYARTTEVGDPTLRAGEGGTDMFGNVEYSTQGTAQQQALARFHERVHSALSPRFVLLRGFRARMGQSAYERSALLRYVEEALAESYAQFRVNGIRGIPEGIRFPIANGYVTLSRVVTEAAIGTIIYAGVLYGVYLVVDDNYDDDDASMPAPSSSP